MNPIAWRLALLLLLAFLATFLVTWWIRGRGFGELLELVRWRRRPLDDEPTPRDSPGEETP